MLEHFVNFIDFLILCGVVKTFKMLLDNYKPQIFFMKSLHSLESARQSGNVSSDFAFVKHSFIISNVAIYKIYFGKIMVASTFATFINLTFPHTFDILYVLINECIWYFVSWQFNKVIRSLEKYKNYILKVTNLLEAD